MPQYYTGLDVSMTETAGFPIEKMSLESGSMSHWLMKELLALGWKISCMDARSIATVLALKQNKTDRNDARGIAEAVRSYSSYIKEVYHKSQESIDLGMLLSARRSLVRQRTVLSNRMRGLLKNFGLCLGGSGVDKIPSLIHKKITEQWPQSIPCLSLRSFVASFYSIDTRDQENRLCLRKHCQKRRCNQTIDDSSWSRLFNSSYI